MSSVGEKLFGKPRNSRTRYPGGTAPKSEHAMEQTELIEDIQIINPLGLHARPAAALVQTVLKFGCDVFIALNGHRVNAKSIMGLLTLAAAHGSTVTVTCAGNDAQEALDAVRGLFESGFGEL